MNVRKLLAVLGGISLLAIGCEKGGQVKDPSNGQVTDSTNDQQCRAESAKLSSTKLIVNGQKEATLFDISSSQKKAVVAVLNKERDDEEWSNICTATVIAPRVVLTAAHCVVDFDYDDDDNEIIVPSDVSVFKIAFGKDVGYACVDDKKLNNYLGKDVFTPTKVIYNPDYAGEPQNDEAIFIFADDLTKKVFNLEVIPPNKEPMTDDYLDKKVQNVGFGSTAVSVGYPYEYDSIDDYYAAYDAAIYNTYRWWTTEPITKVSEEYFEVYGSEVSSVCFGDSGGPALYRGADGILKVLGTVSDGDESCTEYDDYTRVDRNIAWMEEAAGSLLYEEPTLPTKEERECDELGWEGRCEGKVAYWCENNEIKSRDCAKCGQTCGETVSMGNYCL